MLATFDTSSIVRILNSQVLTRKFEKWLAQKENIAILPLEVVSEMMMNSCRREIVKRFNDLDRLKTRKGNQSLFIADSLKLAHQNERIGNIFQIRGDILCLSISARNEIFNFCRKIHRRTDSKRETLRRINLFLAKDLSFELDQRANNAFERFFFDGGYVRSQQDFLNEPRKAIQHSMWLIESLLGCDRVEATTIIENNKDRLLGIISFAIAGHAHALSVISDKRDGKENIMMKKDKNGWVDARVLSTGIKSDFFITDDKRLAKTAEFVAQAIGKTDTFVVSAANDFLHLF